MKALQGEAVEVLSHPSSASESLPVENHALFASLKLCLLISGMREAFEAGAGSS
jgi:hypothetical protein